MVCASFMSVLINLLTRASVYNLYLLYDIHVSIPVSCIYLALMTSQVIPKSRISLGWSTRGTIVIGRSGYRGVR
jgi:hypothetical protein